MTDPRRAPGGAPGARGDPGRVAAIDVGSNAIRFYAAETGQDGARHLIEERRYAIRLGHDVFTEGVIREETAGETCRALLEVAARIGALGVGRYRAVATSAVRESRNRASFLRTVRRQSGIVLHAITGNEEARLVYTAVRERMPLGERPWMFVELGGGSVEMFVADQQRIQWCQVHSMGAVRLKELFVRSGEEPAHFERLLAEYAAAMRLPRGPQGLAGLIATGGNIESLARMDGGGSGQLGVVSLAVERLQALIRELAALTPAGRAERFGLRADRADVILPAAIVYARFAEMAGAREILVPGVGLREGIVLELARSAPPAERRAAEHTVEEAAALGRRFAYDEAHGRKVSQLAVALFDALRPLHRMGEAERRLLEVASLLHDVGYFVTAKSHHKHSLYLLSRAELPGLSSAQMQVVANVARYHRRTLPSLAHLEYAALPAQARRRVRMLAAFLRIADALDREHEGRVERLDAVRNGSAVHLTLKGSGDLLLELWSLKRKADLFEEVFGLRLEGSRAEDGQ